MKNILFICKHNVFRSKVAEAYFNKINENKEVNVDSAGFIKADILSEAEIKASNFQRKIAKELEIDVVESSKGLSISLLRKQDIIIIVADDVPGYIFNNKNYLKPNLKIITWKIPDIKGVECDREFVIKDIKEIMENVGKLVEELK